VTITRDGGYPARVTDVVEFGISTAVTVQLDNGPDLQAWTTHSDQLEVDAPCTVSIEPEAISVWTAPQQAEVAAY
jgi:hypothetical protein